VPLTNKTFLDEEDADGTPNILLVQVGISEELVKTVVLGEPSQPVLVVVTIKYS
jgi:hypothetical protein